MSHAKAWALLRKRLGSPEEGFGLRKVAQSVAADASSEEPGKSGLCNRKCEGCRGAAVPLEASDMADPAKVEELAKDDAVACLAALEPVPVDPTKAATKALEACGGDIAQAKEWIATKVADTSFTWD